MSMVFKHVPIEMTPEMRAAALAHCGAEDPDQRYIRFAVILLAWKDILDAAPLPPEPSQ